MKRVAPLVLLTQYLAPNSQLGETMDNKTHYGTLGEISVTKRLIEDGWDIFLPLNGKTEFDIVAYKQDYGLLSVQVKSTNQKAPSGSYIVELKSIRSNKTANTVHCFNNKIQDILAVYVVELDSVIFMVSKNITNRSTVSISQLDALNLSEQNLSEVLGTLAESA